MQSVFLNKQYRMHPTLSLFPSTEFYGSKLLDDDAYDNPDLIGLLKDPLKNLCFLDVSDGMEEKNGTSFFNQANVSVVEALVKGVFPDHLPTAGVLILTPYAAQSKKLAERLGFFTGRKGALGGKGSPRGGQPRPGNSYHGQKKFENVTVATVDGAQGAESEVVVLDLVRANNFGDLGFLAHDFRRLNVAITRAKRHLIVVGHLQTLERCRKSEFIQVTIENNSAQICFPGGGLVNSLLETMRGYY